MSSMTYNEIMLKRVRQALYDIIDGGASSASISTGTGSKSYTRLDIGKLQELEVYYASRVRSERGSRCGLIGYRRTRPHFGRIG